MFFSLSWYKEKNQKKNQGCGKNAWNQDRVAQWRKTVRITKSDNNLKSLPRFPLINCLDLGFWYGVFSKAIPKRNRDSVQHKKLYRQYKNCSAISINNFSKVSQPTYKIHYLLCPIFYMCKICVNFTGAVQKTWRFCRTFRFPFLKVPLAP